MKTLFLENEAATLAFGAQIANACPTQCVIFLTGNLGAGKTTFVRGFLDALGYQGTVKSPTYTLVEPYEINGKRVFHFDLYRIQDAQELEDIGLRDYFAMPAITLIEWPERAAGMLPGPDIAIAMAMSGSGRNVTVSGRINYAF